MARPIPMRGRVITIGRAAGNTIALPAAPETSRHHADLRRENGQWVVYHRGKNPTRVNGVPVTREVLRDGDELEIGGSHLRLQGERLWVPDSAIVKVRPSLRPILAGGGAVALLAAALLLFRQQRAVGGVVVVQTADGVVGTATVVDARGLLLTDADIVASDPAPLIGVPSGPGKAPAVWYQTRLLGQDFGLATLVVTKAASGEPLTGPLSLEWRKLAAGPVAEGDELLVVGFRRPAVLAALTYNDTARAQEVAVARFHRWPSGGMQWIEMDRDVDDVGYGGGPILNHDREVVAIALPTEGLRYGRPIDVAGPLLDQARRALGW